MESVERASDKGLKWKAVIADAHVNMLYADPWGRYLHPLFGDGPVYYKYVQNIFRKLMKMVDDKKIESIKILGDFFDPMQTDGQDIIHTFLKDKQNKKEWTHKKQKDIEFMKTVNDYQNIVFPLKRKTKEGNKYFDYIIGNHESEINLKEAGIDYKEFSSDETNLLTMVHGDKYDVPMNLIRYGRNQFGHSVCTKRIPPVEKHKFLRKIAVPAKLGFKLFGGLSVLFHNWTKDLTSLISEKQGESSPCFDLMNKKFGKTIAKKYMTFGHDYSYCDKSIKKYKKTFGNFIIAGHEHKAGLFSEGVFLGDLYNYGVNFVAPDKENVYVLFGMKGPNKSRNFDSTYNKLFEKGHMWRHSLSKNSWKFLGEVRNDNIESALANPEKLIKKKEEYLAPLLLA